MLRAAAAIEQKRGLYNEKRAHVNERVSSLFHLCRCLQLSPDPQAIDHVRNDMSNGKVNWECLIDIANHQLVTPSLWIALIRKDLVRWVPDNVRDYLEEIHRLNTNRNFSLKAQATEAIHHLNTVRVEPILLKGCRHLFMDPFGDLGVRMMEDLDIMVPHDALKHSVDALLSVGYTEANCDYSDYECHHHHNPLYREGVGGPIELHTYLCPQNEPQVLPAAEAWRDSRAVSLNGLRFRILSPVHQIVYNVVHSEITHEGFTRGIVAVRQLYDLEVVCSDQAEEVDWPHLREIMKRHGMERILRSFLFKANRLIGTPVPDCLSPTLASRLHLTRCLLVHRFPFAEILAAVPSAFSAKRITSDYKCSDGFWDLTKARLSHFFYLLKRELLGSN